MSDYDFIFPDSGTSTGGSGVDSGLASLFDIDVASLYEGQELSAIDQARASMLVDSAEGSFLTTIGNNYGVPRPPTDPNNDELYRRVIQALSPWQPKPIMLIGYRLAEAIFGTQEALELLGVRAWQFYEVNPNELIFECPTDLIVSSNANASYLHGVSGLATSVGGPSDEFTTSGDVTVAATTLVGLNAYLFYSGVWNTHAIVDATYDAGTGLSTVTVATVTLPALSMTPFFIDVPSASSFRGDYFATSVSEAAAAPRPPIDDHIYIFGQGMLDVFTYYMNLFPRAAGVVLRVETI